MLFLDRLRSALSATATEPPELKPPTPLPSVEITFLPWRGDRGLVGQLANEGVTYTMITGPLTTQMVLPLV